MAAVETIARLAVVHRVDSVLVAGDVFDAQSVADRTIRKLFNARQGFPEPWIMIPSNHVAALTESVWTRAARLDAVPAKLHRALQGMVLDFPALGFSALTAPLTQRHIYTDLTEWFDEAPTAPGHVRSGVPHGGVQGVLAKDIEAANPNRAEWAACAKLGRPTQIILGEALVQSDDQRLEKVKRAHLRCAANSTRRRCLPVIWAPDAAWRRAPSHLTARLRTNLRNAAYACPFLQ